MGNGELGMENGKWGMENGKWGIENGKLGIGNWGLGIDIKSGNYRMSSLCEGPPRFEYHSLGEARCCKKHFLGVGPSRTAQLIYHLSKRPRTTIFTTNLRSY